MSDLKEKLKEHMTDLPDDIILTLFYVAKIQRFNSDAKPLHVAIHTLKKKKPKIFKEFIFSTSGTFPYSNLLERVIGRLITCKIIGLCWEGWDFSKTYRPFVKKHVIPRLKEQTHKDIIEIKDDFKELLMKGNNGN